MCMLSNSQFFGGPSVPSKQSSFLHCLLPRSALVTMPDPAIIWAFPREIERGQFLVVGALLATYTNSIQFSCCPVKVPRDLLCLLSKMHPTYSYSDDAASTTLSDIFSAERSLIGFKLSPSKRRCRTFSCLCKSHISTWEEGKALAFTFTSTDYVAARCP